MIGCMAIEQLRVKTSRLCLLSLHIHMGDASSGGRPRDQRPTHEMEKFIIIFAQSFFFLLVSDEAWVWVWHDTWLFLSISFRFVSVLVLFDLLDWLTTDRPGYWRRNLIRVQWKKCRAASITSARRNSCCANVEESASTHPWPITFTF